MHFLDEKETKKIFEISTVLFFLHSVIRSGRVKNKIFSAGSGSAFQCTVCTVSFALVFSVLTHMVAWSEIGMKVFVNIKSFCRSRIRDSMFRADSAFRRTILCTNAYGDSELKVLPTILHYAMGTGTGTDVCGSRGGVYLFRKIKPPPKKNNIVTEDNLVCKLIVCKCTVCLASFLLS
jgi:hypothetical protein